MHRLWMPLGLLLLAGCATPLPPVADVLPPAPAQWTQAGAAHAEPAEPLDAHWWRAFGSAELDAFVAQAQAQNGDVAAALARVRQAEAAARVAGAALRPQLDASLTVGREGRLGGHADVDGSRWATGLSASYEVDLWNRLQLARDGALASWQASRFDRAAVRLTVTASVVLAWLDAVALAERADIGTRNLHSAERVLALLEARSRAGAALPLELAQQRGLVAGQRRAIAALRQQAFDARTALALLLGQPAPPAVAAQALAGVRLPSVAAGLPSALLTRRPDLARAEARLAAADADVQAARAALLPSLTLTAGAGTGGERLRRLLDNPLYALAAGLAAPIFDGGRLGAQRDLAQARREELLAGYRAAIAAAFGDVEAALNAIAGLADQAAFQEQELGEAQRALALAESRWRAGAETLLTLLDAQRTLFTAQDAAAQLRLARLQAAVALSRALGGGWSATPLHPSEEIAHVP